MSRRATLRSRPLGPGETRPAAVNSGRGCVVLEPGTAHRRPLSGRQESEQAGGRVVGALEDGVVDGDALDAPVGGEHPGLQKDGVEAELQRLLALHVETFGEGWSLVRREYPTAIGPVDLLCRDAAGTTVAVEVKRRGEIDGVEQLTRYLELLNRDPLLAPVKGVFAAQEIKPQARVLAAERGIDCVILDYNELRGIESDVPRLF